MARRGLVAAALSALALPATAGAAPGAVTHQVPAWFAAPSGVRGQSTQDQTIRMIVTPRLGGREARIEVTNRYGTAPTTLARVTVAHSLASASVAPASLRRVTFAGRRQVTLAPGEDRWSDPVPIRVRPGRRLAVSAYLPGEQLPTVHFDAEQVSYLTAEGTGDAATSASGAPFTVQTTSWITAEAVDVRREHPGPTIVTLGDSLTDGHRSGEGAEARYPDVLAGREATKRAGALVVNAGVTSDVLRSASAAPNGTSALARLGADVLLQPNLRAVIVEEGINDLRAHPDLAAGTLIAAFKRLIARLRSHHVRFAIATLAPTGGDPFTGPWVTPRRRRVNRWIRALPPGERVDFDHILRDPSDPLRLRPAYDSGDHLHPSAAGYAAMARGIRLGRLLGGR